MHRLGEAAWPLRLRIELRRRADPGAFGISFLFPLEKPGLARHTSATEDQDHRCLNAALRMCRGILIDVPVAADQ